MDPLNQSGDSAQPSEGSQFVNYSGDTHKEAPPPPNLPSTPEEPVASAPVPTPMSTPPIEPPMPVTPPATPRFTPTPTPPPSVPPSFTPRATMSPNTPPPQSFRPKRRGFMGVVVAAIVVVVLLLAGYAVYASVLSPGNSISSALSGVDSSTMVHTDLVLTLNDPQIATLNGSQLSISSDLDRSNPNVMAFQSTINANSTAQSFTLNVRFIGDTLYFHINNIPDDYLKRANIPKADWYSFKVDTLRSMGALYGAASSTDIMQSRTSLTKTYSDMVAANVFSKMSFKGIGFVNGKLVKKYTIEISRDGLAEYLSNHLPASLNKPGTSPLDRKSYALGILSIFTIQPIDVSLDFLSGALRSIDTTLTLNVPTTGYAPANTATIGVHAAYDTSMKTAVVVPQGVVPLDDIFTRSLQSAKDQGKNARIMSDVQQIRTQLESDYTGTSYQSCSTKTITTIKNDISANGSSLICRLTPSKYLVAAKLLDVNGQSKGYFCVDSTGKTNTSGPLPSGYLCN